MSTHNEQETKYNRISFKYNLKEQKYNPARSFLYSKLFTSSNSV